MLKLTLFGLCLAALAAGCATAPGTLPESRIANAVPAPAICVQDTGSRIPHNERGGACLTPGRVYTGDQLRSTGSFDTADALRMLDPSITVHH